MMEPPLSTSFALILTDFESLTTSELTGERPGLAQISNTIGVLLVVLGKILLKHRTK
jgi:hypothetical protein